MWSKSIEVLNPYEAAKEYLKKISCEECKNKK